MCRGAPPNSLSRSFAIVAAASAPVPWTRVVCMPSGASAAPTTNAWAPFAAPEPGGSSASIAVGVAPGSSSGARDQERRPDRFGHQDGRGDRALPVVFVDEGDGVGGCSGSADGKTASATSAALEAGSGPPTLVVLLVANSGYPSSSGTSVAAAGVVVGSVARRLLGAGRGAGDRVALVGAAEDRGDDKDDGDEDERPDRLQRRRAPTAPGRGGGGGGPPGVAAAGFALGSGTSALIGWFCVPRSAT